MFWGGTTLILMVMAISGGTMFVRKTTSFKDQIIRHIHGDQAVHPDDNMFREVEDRETKTINFFIVPGTTYCGLGNSSDSLKHFAVFPKTDKCCQHHDDCETILSGETKYGLTNKGLLPTQPCHCDHTFKDCLLTSNTWLSNEIGDLYFNNLFMTKHCFEATRPFEACGGYTVVDGMHRCTDPIFSREGPLTYKWFAVPFYIKSAPRNAIEDHTEIVHNELVEN